VWSDLYLDEGQRNEWIALQGLASWSEGDWEERGTEHAADIIAFGLHDTMHVPTGIGVTDYRSLVESFEWLLGTAPLHRQHGDHATSGRTTSQRIQVVAPRRVAPSDAPALAEPTSQASPASEFTFPMACGYPRWNSLHGGFGYVDPRDWTHNGVDLYAFEGTPVVSPVHGTVVEAGWGDVTGWKVVVADRFGYRHVMEHLARSPTVAVGMSILAGQVVGSVGRTGNAAGGGPHLHYEIRLDGEPVDPMPWLRATGGSHVEGAPASLYATTAPVWSACAAKA
jgi:biotin carboxyl carrier protein